MMNERIRELAEESYNEFYNVHIDLELFVELIVKEILHNMENCDGDLDFAIWKTKKDFGVK
jgi:hypothetical protein